VLPPHDKGIIECVYKAADIPTLDFDEAVGAGRIKPIGEEVDRAYLDAVLALSLSSGRSIKGLFTPLHGVGETSVYRVLKEAGFADVGIFEPQRAPDGNFPNVPDSLPNPERSEVFDPAIQAAAQSDVELILAADPDADRLGVAVRGVDGSFTHLSGNRIGVLLVDYVLRKRAAAGTLSKDHYVVETLVTTPLVAKIARSHGVRAIDDLLVGFKYIAQTMDREGPDRFVFGTEESLGYLAGEYCRDKDAAIAALYLAEAAAELRAEGKTLLDRLDELYGEFGYHVEGQRSEVCPGSRGREQIEGILEALREAPPAELAGLTPVRVNDYLKHEVRSLPENRRERELPEPSGDLLFFEAVSDECRVRFAARPSGTEPKIKFYLFASGDAGDAESLESSKGRIDGIMTDFSNALGEWVRSRISE
jgi:phosphoglucomutase/phosphomannomutase